MEKALATIVIPLRLPEPSALEKVSLDQTIAVLRRYPITFMAPTGLDTAWYEDYCRGKIAASVERFSWQGFEEFTKLLLSATFYERFLDYEYMLVCHLDAFVFRDEVEQWCRAGYDYVGAVIYNPEWIFQPSLLRTVTGFTPREYFGNGGFALKKISSFYHVTSTFQWYINFNFWVRNVRGQGLLEDIFLTQHFPRLSAKFKIPPKAVAQKFGAAYEIWKQEDLPFTNEDNRNLPFGTHGWIQHHQDFWRPCIRRCGYAI
ncbi:MAG: DUF5672 family protein [Janthinobacterium lividum]